MKLFCALLRTIAFLSVFATVPIFAHSASDKDDGGCGCDMPKAAAKPSDTHTLKGVIVDILPGQSALLVKHEDVAGLMKGMTMDFKVDASILKSAQKGEAITATLSQRGDDWWLTDVKPVAKL